MSNTIHPPERVVLENTDYRLVVHSRKRCEGGVCPIHNRSAHSMRSFPQGWDTSRSIMIRVCPHFMNHPDPDDLKVRRGDAAASHVCDGCCKR